MIQIKKDKYSLNLNERCGIVENLRLAGDPDTVNLVHKDEVSAFGSVAYTRNDESFVYEDYNSPVNAKSWAKEEYHAFSNLRERAEDFLQFRNSAEDFGLTYQFYEDSFTMLLEAEMPHADMIALDLNTAFVDLRQNDPIDYQYTFHSFYRSEDCSLAYVYLDRIDGQGGILINSCSDCAGWRIRYGNVSRGAGALQFAARFPEELAKEVKNGPVSLKVRVSFHDSLEEALNQLGEWEEMSILSAPILSGVVGDNLTFSCSGQNYSLTLSSPTGEVSELPASQTSFNLKEEGFYKLIAKSVSGRAYELVFHSRDHFLPLLERSRQHLEPLFFCCNAEHFAWVQAMLVARNYLGTNERMELYLYDALITVGRNGVKCSQLPKDSEPTPEQTAQHLKERHPVMVNESLIIDGKSYIGTPSLEPFEFNGRILPKYHIYKTERLQDAFSFVLIYLEASKTYQSDELYEFAVDIALAHIESHLDEDGALRKFEHNMMIDYTTVIAPAASLSELYSYMLERNDPRSEVIGNACIRIADYLVKRGMNFPTEGDSVHIRWTEDGSISCTALSLLWVYKCVEKKPEYLSFAGEILDFHHPWQIETPDVRSNCATWRYWESQWENDGEGRSINAGHVWNLWRGEALFHYGVITGDAKSLLDSWNCFGSNLCKIQKNGATYSSFIPDYMVQRPREKKLYHCYPDNEDRTIAFYLWGRLANTWLNTTAVVDTPLGIVALNGKLTPEQNKLKLHSYAVEDKNIILLTREKDTIV